MFEDFTDKDKQIENLKELVKAQDEYIEVLNAELGETVSVASTHGWVSTRFMLGMEKRFKIKRLKEGIK